MTTRLKLSTVKREVVTDRGEKLIVSFTPAGVTTREKGRRTMYGPIPYGHLHLIGARMRAEEIRRERKQRRKARRTQ